MILLVNGPFGIGKTTTAKLVCKRLEDAFLFDPEILGAALRRIGATDHDDYQDSPVWRDLVVATAASLRRNVATMVVVPMCLLRLEIHDEIVAGWSSADDVVRVRLTASEATLRDRILGRPDEEGPHEWCLAHLDSGLRAVRDDAFGSGVDTEGRTPDQVADAIVELVRHRPS